VAIHDLDIVYMAIAPHKADTKLIVDANAVLTRLIAAHGYGDGGALTRRESYWTPAISTSVLQ